MEVESRGIKNVGGCTPRANERTRAQMAVAEAEGRSVGVGMQWTIGAGEAGDRANDIGCAGRHTFADWGVAVSARCQTLQSTRPCWRCDRGRDGGGGGGGGGGGCGGCDVKCLGAGAGAGGGEVDAEAMQCDRRKNCSAKDERTGERAGGSESRGQRACTLCSQKARFWSSARFCWQRTVAAQCSAVQRRERCSRREVLGSAGECC